MKAGIPPVCSNRNFVWGKRQLYVLVLFVCCTITACDLFTSSRRAGHEIAVAIQHYKRANYEKSFDLLHKNTGTAEFDAEAQYYLGKSYFFGNGTHQDCYNAALWFEQAAVEGHKGAQYFMASCHFFGICGESNMLQAIDWAAKAQEFSVWPADPVVRWSSHIRKIAELDYELVLEAVIDFGWHINSLSDFPEHKGYNNSPTSIAIEESGDVHFTGCMQAEGELISLAHEWLGPYEVYTEKVQFTQSFTTELKQFSISGEINYIIGSLFQTIPPQTIPFEAHYPYSLSY